LINILQVNKKRHFVLNGLHLLQQHKGVYFVYFILFTITYLLTIDIDIAILSQYRINIVSKTKN